MTSVYSFVSFILSDGTCIESVHFDSNCVSSSVKLETVLVQPCYQSIQAEICSNFCKKFFQKWIWNSDGFGLKLNSYKSRT